jgi:acyl-CoA synthetase (AMP-forming)/AMP-acid ligase II
MIYTLKRDKVSNFNKWSKILSTVLANYKIPTRYIDIEDLGYQEIPKASNGKILRSKVKEITNKLL